MNRTRNLVQVLAAVILLAPAAGAWAQWELDTTRSAVNFVSIKNGSVAETHSFSSLVGFISGDGKVQLDINLDSVETLIPIRNERMRELLFDTVKFPTAKITAAVDPVMLAEAAQGGTVTTGLSVTLSLHGNERSLVVPVIVVGEESGQLQVFTPRPVLINAADFGLLAGITALQNIAGLQSISTAVPVTVHLYFARAAYD